MYGCCNVWFFYNCVGILTIYLFVFTVFCIVLLSFCIVYFVYIYSYLLLV